MLESVPPAVKRRPGGCHPKPGRICDNAVVSRDTPPDTGECTVPLKLIHVGLGGWGTDWELNALPPVKDQVERVAIVEAFEPALEKAKTRLKLKDAQAFATLDAALDAV